MSVCCIMTTVIRLPKQSATYSTTTSSRVSLPDEGQSRTILRSTLTRYAKTPRGHLACVTLLGDCQTISVSRYHPGFQLSSTQPVCIETTSDPASARTPAASPLSALCYCPRYTVQARQTQATSNTLNTHSTRPWRTRVAAATRGITLRIYVCITNGIAWYVLESTAPLVCSVVCGGFKVQFCVFMVLIGAELVRDPCDASQLFC